MIKTGPAYHMLDPTAELASERLTRRTPPPSLEGVTGGALRRGGDRPGGLRFLHVVQSARHHEPGSPRHSRMRDRHGSVQAGRRRAG
jgi:hypothetical protein